MSSTKTLTGHLALFFAFFAAIIGIVNYIIFYTALHWSEDRVGERRILLDRNEAIHRYQSGQSGKLTIDILTNAYNDWSLIPNEYYPLIYGKSSFLGEIGEEPESRLVYIGQYTNRGKTYPIILLTKVDKVELQLDEFALSVSLVMSFITVIMLLLGTLLYRLSQQLIEPLNSLSKQLKSKTSNIEQEFTIKPTAATEFKLLTKQMNHYRSETSSLLKREQAFARYASHELRTPLTVVRGASNLLRRGNNNEFQTRQIQRIDDATFQMSTMVDALLSLVRYERSQEPEPKRAFNADELHSIIDKNSAQAYEKDINIECNVLSSPRLEATTAVMNMIVGNLIRNAIAATNQGNIYVVLSADSISIRDQGEGLKGQPNSDGHGLGLLIVDDLCSRYGWSFTLKNHSQGGCNAIIKFS